MTSIVERDVTPPTSFIAGYPSDLEKIVLTALSRDRSRRWPSASHLARAIEDYCASLGIVATHQALSRYYQQAFRGDDRSSRATLSQRPPASVRPRGSEPPRSAHGSRPPVSASASRPAVGTQPPRAPSQPSPSSAPASSHPSTPGSEPPRSSSAVSSSRRPASFSVSHGNVLDDLRALRSAPPTLDRVLSDTPGALHLPAGADEVSSEDTPLVLSRPKRGA